MGTNYYHEKLLCEHCGNAERTHIGKSSAGWTFSFHATESARSWAEWLAVLQAGGRIVDEYGDEHSLDEFKELVERKRSASHNAATEALAGAYGPSYASRNFLDPEGHSFYDGEFS